MDFYQAIEAMRKGTQVQSLVSNIKYELNMEGLLVGGQPVPEGFYITVQEASGEWQEIRYPEKAEGLADLLKEEMNSILIH